MQRHNVLLYLLAITVVFTSACAAEVLDEAQAGDGEDRPEVALDSEAVVHNDSLTFLQQNGIGSTQRTTYGVNGFLEVGITGSGPSAKMFARWKITNGSAPSRVKWAFAVHCGNASQNFDSHGDNLLRASGTNGQTWVCDRVTYAEFSFIVDN